MKKKTKSPSNVIVQASRAFRGDRRIQVIAALLLASGVYLAYQALAASPPKKTLYRYYSSTETNHYYPTGKTTRAGYKLQSCEGLMFANPESKTVPFWRYWNARKTDDFYTVDRNDAGYARLGYVNKGVIGYVYSFRSARPAGTIPLRRFFNSTAYDHFYTVDYLTSGTKGYNYQRTEAWILPPPPDRCRPAGSPTPTNPPGGTNPQPAPDPDRDHDGTPNGSDRCPDTAGPGANQGCPVHLIPMYRYYSSGPGDNVYTTDRNDSYYNGLGYAYFGCPFGVFNGNDGQTLTPLYRYYSGRGSDHFYTIDRNDSLLAYYGYSYEGVAGWVRKEFTSGFTPLARYYNASNVSHLYDPYPHPNGWYGYNFEKYEGYVQFASC